MLPLWTLQRSCEEVKSTLWLRSAAEKRRKGDRREGEKEIDFGRVSVAPHLQWRRITKLGAAYKGFGDCIHLLFLDAHRTRQDRAILRFAYFTLGSPWQIGTQIFCNYICSFIYFRLPLVKSLATPLVVSLYCFVLELVLYFPCMESCFALLSIQFQLLRSKITSSLLDEVMTGVIEKFFITSMVMWMAPLAILYSFYYGYIPGASQLSAENKTLISGFIAVISVNLVIGFYICMAMKESPSSTNPQPDPKFLAEAKASINQSENAASSSTGVDQTSGKDSDQNKGKME